MASFAFADKVQEGIEKQLTLYQIIRIRDEIEKDFNTKRLSAKSDFPIVRKAPKHFFVGEAMVALVLADALLEKFGGDSLSELRRNFDSYLDHLRERGFGER